MRRKYNYPFTAVVGQDQVKKALLVILVNQKVGGLLIGGPSGTAKTTLVRACESLMNKQKIIELPLNITEDMFFGSIDFEYAVNKGQKKWHKGILDRADNNLLYIDEVNLLRTELLDAVCRVQQSNFNFMVRDGAQANSVNFALVATMNPHEMLLPEYMLDKFGLYVESTSEKDAGKRVEIVKRRMAFENNPCGFCEAYKKETSVLARKIAKARIILSQVQFSEAVILLAAQMCAKAFCVGHQAELYLLETARALAALADRTYVLPKDLNEAAVLVLVHRSHKQSQNKENKHNDSDNTTENNSDAMDRDDEKPNETPPAENEAADTENTGNETQDNDSKPAADNIENKDQNKEQESNSPAPEEKISDIDKRISMPQLELARKIDKTHRRGSGKRSITKTDLKRGRYVRARIPHGMIDDIALDATIRNAAVYQKARSKNDCALTILSEDIRQKVREKRIGSMFLFVVDASGSMGAYERMHAVKGAIFNMLRQAYQKRDRVGMIAFRKDKAEVLLPVTRSIDLAQKCLQKMPTGGKTPLAQGLNKALQVLKMEREKDIDAAAVLILITDGRANSKLENSDDPVKKALETAQEVKRQKIDSVVIDTETDFIKLGIAGDIAKAMGGTYYELTKLKTENVLRIIDNIGE
ncbi:VWA domain-containing protein [Pectinatus sottacetonis]|uniref:VWA domain-containing protein n=1 Tax=Pectinatus sottacetonis TaxID=1002795 RepID=UPI0018C604A3|nr:VWA domain-containing protein [Pectinatus sottacetonis]